MAVILKKLKGKSVHKEDQGPEWEHLLTLLKLLLILFLIFSCFHWIVKKRVQHLPAQLGNGAGQTTATKTDSPSFMRLYTVKDGDTLWKIAVTHFPNENPVAKINEIKRINQMVKDAIKPGQMLKLP
ncbi:LysM peptidoglycan-binding domain-containing protein [Ammoniphilus sp. CFH 90114]|uniref:LysM peptidoglycan-binding domain-containing protein n=1 Tax=Ammoniphilus sp. CFH 90114 TaxID=2493665 RepID=UPI00100DD660|nr:LysM peptidoglycan-binding domain-containing protein [Ammoniphilus sp. CFH 90114]RXT14824.1 LysM peptidoglycan-binding domain-containing protein [Ammoniphilus sp. CFH 90114]